MFIPFPKHTSPPGCFGDSGDLRVVLGVPADSNTAEPGGLPVAGLLCRWMNDTVKPQVHLVAFLKQVHPVVVGEGLLIAGMVVIVKFKVLYPVCKATGTVEWKVESGWFPWRGLFVVGVKRDEGNVVRE